MEIVYILEVTAFCFGAYSLFANNFQQGGCKPVRNLSTQQKVAFFLSVGSYLAALLALALACFREFGAWWGMGVFLLPIAFGVVLSAVTGFKSQTSSWGKLKSAAISVLFVPLAVGYFFLRDAYAWFALATLPLMVEMLLSELFSNNPGPVSEPRTTPNSSATGTPEIDALSLFPARKARFNFGDVEGMSKLKADLLSARESMKNEGKNGILFSGEPGNGKTFITEALAGEMGINFLEVRIGEIASRFVNQSTEQAQAAFAAARMQAPCLLFLDEVDSVLRDRTQSMMSTDGEPLRLTNALLTLIADMRSHPEYGVTIVAATNFKDQLDPAAIREGRFDFKIEVPCPDLDARVALIKNNIAKTLSFEGDSAERAARRWEGFSVARLKEVSDRVSKNAISLGQTKISFKAICSALREVQGSLGGKLAEGTPTLNQLHFDETLRNELMSLSARMVDIERIESMGGTVPKGVLFHGPGGTGKTAVAKSLAVSSGWAFLHTTGQELSGTPAVLDDLVKKANDLRPCIIFIDEADDILADRSTNPYGKAATNKLLAVMDGGGNLHDVMFVAATNFPDYLDSAAVRGGRFSETFEFKVPGEATMVAIIADYMKAKAMAPWDESFTPEEAAPLLSGLAPADVKDRLQKVINRVAGRGHGKITLEELKSVI